MKYVVANIKMNKSYDEMKSYLMGMASRFSNDKVDLTIAMPYTYISLGKFLLEESAIRVGGQNLSEDEEGKSTGEISGRMLRSSGAENVIIGHSERRQYFGETDATVNARIKAALKAGLKPIVCVGELLEDRENGNTEKVIGTQLEGGLAGLTGEDMSNVVIAYEPVWAIGTGKTATPEVAELTHNFIRCTLKDMFGAEVGEGVRIQYGGSMKAENAAELVAQPNIDGGLIGGAALKAESFSALIHNAIAG